MTRRTLYSCIGCLTALAFPLAVWGQEAPSPEALLTPHGPALFGGRLLQLVLAVGLGFAIGAFFSARFKKARRMLALYAATLALLFSLFGPFPWADMVGWMTAVILFLVAFAFGIRLGAKAVAAARAARKPPTSFGSAKWATYDYLAGKGLFARGGFLLGGFNEANPAGDRRSMLRYEGARHLLTVAPTRSGKGVSSIIPNLLLHEGSALVVDPKGENALITALRRGDGDPERGIPGMGQEVVLLDPWDIAASELKLKRGRFNPLDWIRPADPDAAENAFLLADALVMREAGARDEAFWDEEAKALLTGIILYVATAPAERAQRDLGRVRDILTLDDDGFDEQLRLMFDHAHPIVRSTASRTASKEPKLRSNVITTAQAHTHFLESPRIRASLAASDFSFEDLKAKKLTVYLILPADRLSTFNRWMRLLIQQAITVNARNISTPSDKPILFMLDEMATLGKLPAIEQAYGLMAGFGMQLWGVVQDLSQLAKVYGEHGWQTFVSNSGVIQYFGSRDKMTAEYFSSLCGVTTVEVHNFSWAVGQAISIATSSGNTTSTTSSNWTRTTGVNESQRQLAYPDELMVLKGDEQIIFVENLDPILGEKLIWYKNPNLAQLGVNLKTPPEKAPVVTIERAAA